MTRELLHAGVHVLVEKPMARTYEECMSMIEASESSGATLMVGLRRRFVFASQWMKRTVASGALGTIQTFDFQEGRVFDWPIVSDSFWRREQAGGGVLIDIGPHVLDQLMWWLGPVKTVRYADDARGGVEGECELELELESGARGRVELSRMRFLRGSAIIVGSRGQVEIALDGNWAERRLPGSRRLPLFPRQSWDDVFPVELRNWLDTVVGGAPAVSARDAAATAQLIDTCYAQRSPLTLPWRDLVPGAVSGGQP